MDRPNILVLISHDLGCHIGPYGTAAEQSPNLMQLAKESVRFDSHFVTSPGCSQSRSSLVTGRFPHANGQFGLANWGWKLHEDEILLPAHLREHGYHSALIGIWHLHEWTLQAFDSISDDVSTVDRSPEGFAEVAGSRAARWLEKNANQSAPFYLHIGFWEVHRPFCGNEFQRNHAETIEASYLQIPEFLPDNDATRREIAELNQSVSLVDQGVGRVLEALEATGQAENTIVIFTADHGLPFPRAKGTLYDPGIKVALMMRWPERFRAGTTCDRLTSNVDIMPTILDLTGIPAPEGVQGKSFAAVLNQPDTAETPEEDECVYAEKSFHEHYDPIRCIRTADYKYIRNFASRPMLVLPSDIYNSPTRISITDDEAIWSARPIEELYNIANDPLETENLIDDPSQKDVATRLSRKLQRWMQDTGDPLLAGPIPRPGSEEELGMELPL